MRLPILSLRTAASCSLWTLVALGTRAETLRGQGAAASIVHGTVIEALSGGAVAGATVDLRAKHAAWHHTDRTDERGQYRFAGVRAGDYELRVRAVGFQPRALQVSLGAASAHISVGVEPFAVSLAPVTVVRQAPDLFARVSARDASRSFASDLPRGAAFMSLDARAIDYDEITRTITPGEPDLMRTLLRHPAAQSRDDYSSALWIRGAPWDESLVTFDGVPLFNPLHAAGAVGAINLDGLGAVAFLPTPISSEHVGSASGHVALSSRRGTSDSTTAHVLSGLSVFSGSAALDGARSDGRADWMIAARRSHIDLVTGAAARMVGSDIGRVPYDFSDIIARGGVELARGWRADVSALEEGDRLRAPIVGIVDGGSGSWGGFARRVSVTGQLPHGTVHIGAMASGFASHLVNNGGGPALDSVLTVADNVLFAVRETLYKPQPLSNVVAYRALTAAWAFPDSARGGAGAQIIEQSASDSTTGSWPHSTQVLNSTNIAGTLRYLAVWGDRSWTPIDRLALRTGLRVETGGRPGGSAAPRMAPSVSLRWKAGMSTAFSMAAARTFQYAQTLAPSGPGRNAIATTGAFWVVAGDTVPMARTDMLTIASEQRFGSSTYAAITAYQRKTNGAVVAEPLPGPLVERPLFVSGVRAAHGIELSVRHFGARFVGSTSLALGRSTIDASGLRYDAPEDRRAAFRADGTFRLSTAVRAMLAFSHADGVPFTRYHEGTVMASPSGVLSWRTPPRIEDPSGARSDPYRSIDLGLERVGRWGAGEVTMYVQVRNVTGARNDAAYLNSVGQCAPSVANCNPVISSTFVDTRLTPLRFFPAAGVRFAF
jgi:hypothetical protein